MKKSPVILGLSIACASVATAQVPLTEGTLMGFYEFKSQTLYTIVNTPILIIEDFVFVKDLEFHWNLMVGGNMKNMDEFIGGVNAMLSYPISPRIRGNFGLGMWGAVDAGNNTPPRLGLMIGASSRF